MRIDHNFREILQIIMSPAKTLRENDCARVNRVTFDTWKAISHVTLFCIITLANPGSSSNMTTKRKYPKSFYDDGLGDILEWIDDEVLVHSESKPKGERSESNEITPKKTGKKSIKLYGDNQIEDNKRPRRVKFDIQDGEEDVELGVDKKLEDRVRGLLNRLAAQNMAFIAAEFEKLYSMNSKSEINTSVWNCIESSITGQHQLAKRKLVAELMLLVSYLTSKISQDIGASLVHRLVSKFELLYKQDISDDDKRLDNILGCLVNLYIIGLIKANVIFEVTKRICSNNFRAKSVELLLFIIKSVGFQLRKDCPLLMRQLILSAHDNCKSLKSGSDQIGSKVEFMIEALSAIKNNNMSKLSNYGCDIDRETIESTLKSLIKRTRINEPLADATYEEILKSSNFYLLETRVEDEPKSQSDMNSAQMDCVSSKLDGKICKALGFNKPAEKTIFCALLRVSDCIEASNLIIGFGLNHCSDAMLVCIHVAIHEKKYNPFHFNLISNLCKFNRKYKMATKFTIQDKIRGMSQMPMKRVDIFKVLCLELIKSDAIPITILKAVEWADLSNATKAYLSFLLESISELPEEAKRKIMSKVDKRGSFAGAMRTFTNCFLKGCDLFQ